MEYMIKDVCNKLNLSVHSVRYYCDMGLVPNLKYDHNKNRIFDDESINWLKAVKFLRASNMAIIDIKKYFNLCLDGNSTKIERKNILINLLKESEKEYELLKQRIECLKNKIDSFDDNDNTNPLNW